MTDPVRIVIVGGGIVGILLATKLGDMLGLDRARHRVQLGALRTAEGDMVLEPREVEYDALVLALGSQANDFCVPRGTNSCYFIDSQKQAETFNEELRARAFRSVACDEVLRVAIVAGGAIGVELAAELSRLLEVASPMVMHLYASACS